MWVETWTKVKAMKPTIIKRWEKTKIYKGLGNK